MIIMGINMCHFNTILVMFRHFNHGGYGYIQLYCYLGMMLILDSNRCLFHMMLVTFCPSKHEGYWYSQLYCYLGELIMDIKMCHFNLILVMLVITIMRACWYVQLCWCFRCDVIYGYWYMWFDMIMVVIVILNHEGICVYPNRMLFQRWRYLWLIIVST
jgi:hypothetical protein